MADHNNVDDYDDEDEGQKMKPEEMEAKLMEAVKANDNETVEEMIKMGASVTCERDGWNPLLWASCNGNEEIVKTLIRSNAHTQYVNIATDNDGADKNVDEDGNNDPFKKPKDAQKVGKYTPLHWASYKGHLKVVWLLMRSKLSAFDIDMHGNTSIHQAASDAQGLAVLKCFMSRGCDLGMKNARGHTPFDLATTQETRDLIERATKTVKCRGKNCGQSKFDFKNVRYYCEACTNFYCEKCCIREDYYENENCAEGEKERPVCFCTNCKNEIEKAEKDLRDAMATEEFEVLHKVLSKILSDKRDICIKLQKQAERLHLKLEKELDIRNFINSVAHVDNYKTILKSVKTLELKQEKAESLGVNLDPALIQNINECIFRLNAERNLRFEMDNTDIMKSTDESIQSLQDLITIANEKTVEDCYMKQANELSGKMRGNLDSRNIYAMLEAYP